MSTTLLRALIALVPTSLLVAGAGTLVRNRQTAGAVLQLLGAGCLLGVALVHICEGLHLLAWMQWGREHSIGHYVDLATAVLGLTLFPVGYLLHALATRRYT